MRELLSNISLIASILYLVVGYYVYHLNKKSKICKLFFVLTISLAIWSFGYSYAYIAVTPIEYSFWNKLSAFGWCTFTSLTLYLILIITDNKLIKKWYIKVLVILPAPVFLFMALFLFGPNIQTNKIVENFFYTGNFLYNFIYLLLSICIIFLWGHHSQELIHKKRANLIVITSIIPFLLNLLTENILPMLGIIKIPLMGQIYSLIFLCGVYHAIIIYQFMAIPTSLITSELFNELSGLTFLVDTKGIIIKANKQSYTLLNYSDNELVNISAASIFIDTALNEIMKNYSSVKNPIKYDEVYISSKSGIHIPFSITLTPLFNSKTQLYLGLLIIGQDIRTTKKLQSEITKHKLTYDKLRNSEELFRTIIEIIPFSIILTSRLDHKVLYANNLTTQLFKIEKLEFIGSDARNYYKDPEQRWLLIEEINKKITIKEREIIFTNKIGIDVLGLITMVPAIYLDQEVILTCISDITEQRKLQQEVAKSEKKLKELMLSIPDIVIVTDLKGNITFANNSFSQVDILDENLDSHNILSYVLPEEQINAMESMTKILTDNPGPVDFKSKRNDGTIAHVELNGTVIYDEKNNPSEIIYVVRNITERKLVEAKLKQNSEEIQKMNKELIEMNNVLKNSSIRDSLTGLYHHQYINELLDFELSKASINEESLCVMMLDIDLFKRVNDTFGHQVGDKVLVVISELISKNVRSFDLIGRYGGEEFIAVLPKISIKEAYQIAENIRTNISEFDYGIANLHVTISIGLAQYTSEDGKTLVNRADTLLYQAKRNGRNRVEYL